MLGLIIRFWKVFLFGIISGSPFAILYTTIIALLTESGIDIALVTTLALARLPYSLKFFWSPFIDKYNVPVFHTIMGHRRSWMFLTSIGIGSLLFYISRTSPTEHFTEFRIASFIIGFFAATYDIAYDALRIEMLKKDEQAMGAATASLAFRIGCLITGAGALNMAHFYGWENTFIALSGLFFLGALFSLVIQTKINPDHNIDDIKDKNEEKSFFEYVILPFQNFFSKQYSILILFTIVIYKLGDSMLSFAGLPLYLSLGFTKLQISYVVKGLGLGANILGSYVGAFIMMRAGNLRGLFICGIAQMLTNLTYVWLNHNPGNQSVFMVAVISENFTGGMGAAALGGYISNLCSIRYAATQFALLSSAATLMNNTLTSLNGKLINTIGWDWFIISTAVVSIPSLLMLRFLHYKTNAENETVSEPEKL